MINSMRGHDTLTPLRKYCWGTPRKAIATRSPEPWIKTPAVGQQYPGWLWGAKVPPASGEPEPESLGGATFSRSAPERAQSAAARVCDAHSARLCTAARLSHCPDQTLIVA
ncbi:hypothetical protein Y1Q_0014177 [Alligator mississippiensis]|uniref:Uncharacterized protein n=1 Tax=Alligator mississippiensis TaxID=8496 RepID=A0A151MU28_ALLMI|nr:hypothetical protein Y1Q_0014177 [Alligator mississippiensis]